MSTLADRLLALHAALGDSGIPHAFGGAIALAYCTEDPRGTRDIDVNVFVGASHAQRVLIALPPSIAVGEAALTAVGHEGQVRVWWDDTPIDLFFNVHDFHGEVAAGVRTVPFAGEMIPVLGCMGLAVFKALFNRTKDWADIEAMVDAGALDITGALGWVTRLVGTDHPAAARLAALL